MPNACGPPTGGTKDTKRIYSSSSIRENICPNSSGEKVVHMCESNFASGTSIYLDTFKAVDYQGSCVCTLRAQGGAVDFQMSVQGVHADCDATLFVPPPIDHTYNCVDKTPSTTTGRIGSGQMLFISLTKNSDVADFCVHLVQTSTVGSLNVVCTQGTLKPTTTIATTTITPPPAVTSSPTTTIENACQSDPGNKEGSLNLACSTGTLKTTTPATTTSSPATGNSNAVTTSNTSVAVTKVSSTTHQEDTVTESKDTSTANPDNTVTESKDPTTVTVAEIKDQSTASSNDTVTDSREQSSKSQGNTVTESKDSSSESPVGTITESNVSSGGNQNMTSSGRTGVDNTETPQSVIVVSFVVVGVFAAAVVVMILFGLFTYCRDKLRLEKMKAGQDLPNGHTTV
ncbi:mucin-21-like [Haliotis asinina]|uniref:mucin-21-like n=1 Tax=Haliotis asinina TaxID=109174 RepID=UPI0035320856